jgi:septin family protein
MVPKVFLLVGDTESEKISFINQVCDDQFTPVEIENILNSTQINIDQIGKSSKLFPGENSVIFIIDVFSFNDDIDSINNILISKFLISQIFDNHFNKIDWIIIFESVYNNQICLAVIFIIL